MKTYRFAGVAAVLLASTQVPQAVPITGSIGFTGDLTYDTSSSGSATAVTSWIDPEVLASSGVFALPSVYAIAPFTPATFTTQVWHFNDPSTPINNFWSVGGFTFELLSSYVASQGGSGGVNAYVDVDGTGLVSGNGYTPTVMSFNLSSQDPTGGTSASGVEEWTFSASGASTISTVMDGGNTLILLGVALTGVGLAARKAKRSLASPLA